MSKTELTALVRARHHIMTEDAQECVREALRALTSGEDNARVICIEWLGLPDRYIGIVIRAAKECRNA